MPQAMRSLTIQADVSKRIPQIGEVWLHNSTFYLVCRFNSTENYAVSLGSALEENRKHRPFLISGSSYQELVNHGDFVSTELIVSIPIPNLGEV